MYLIDPGFNMALVQMTNRCNIACRHCYVSSHPRGAFGLSRERLLRLVDELEAYGIARLALSGGEPLSRAQDCLAVLRHAHRRLDLLLLTNAMLITPLLAAKLVELDPVVRVSVDGASARMHDRMRGPGSFARTMRGVERLLEAGIDPARLEIFATLPDDALGELPGILEIATRLGVERLKVEPVSRTGRAVESWGPMTFDADDPATRHFRALFDAGLQALGADHWRIDEIADTAFRVVTIYENGEVYPYTWTDGRDRSVGLLGSLHVSPLAEILKREAVSIAVLTKIAMMSLGPRRSLRALRLTRSALAPQQGATAAARRV